MNESAVSENSPRSRRRRWWQFSIRTMMLLTVLAALVIRWTLEPEEQEEPFPGGASIREQVVVVNESESLEAPQTIAQGRYRVVDPLDRRLVQGQKDKDQRVGRWRIYHPNGRVAQVGKMDEDCFAGPWRYYDANGVLRTEVGFRKTERAMPGKGWLETPIIIDDSQSQAVAMRTGPSARWDERGRLRAEGQFDHDQRQGTWTFYDKAGHVIAEGNYRDGARVGTWRIRESADQPFQTVRYADGLIIPPRDESDWESVKGESGSSESGSPPWNLTRIRRTVGQPDFQTEVGRRQFKKLLTSSDPLVRQLAYRRLQWSGPAARFAAARLEQPEQSESSRELQIEHRMALWSLEPARTRDILLSFKSWRGTKHEGPLLSALLGQPHLDIDRLIQLLDDNNAHVRRLACDVLYGLLTEPHLNPQLNRRDPKWLAKVVRLLDAERREQLRHPDIRAGLEKIDREIEAKGGIGWGGGFF